MQFYQINYAIYPQGTGIKTYSSYSGPDERKQLEQAKEIFASYGKDISSYLVPEGGKVEKIRSTVTLKAGSSAQILNVEKPGRLIGIRIRPAEAFAGKNRHLVLRAYWDNESEPGDPQPGGRFFRLRLGRAGGKIPAGGFGRWGELLRYFPMPFETKARLELYAEPGYQGPSEVEAEILFAPVGLKKMRADFTLCGPREPDHRGEAVHFHPDRGPGTPGRSYAAVAGFRFGDHPVFRGR